MHPFPPLIISRFFNLERELHLSKGPSRVMLNGTSQFMLVAVQELLARFNKSVAAGLHCEINVGISLIKPQESRTKRIGEKYRNIYLGLDHAS